MNYYNILNLPNNASKSQIRDSYKKLALLYHPDKNKNGLEQFKIISQAYHVLYDNNLRKQYDNGNNIYLNINNPYDILDLFYKDLFTSNQFNKIKIYLKKIISTFNLKNNTSIDLLYSIILDLIYKKNNNNNNNNTENIFIKVTYSLEDHFKYHFNKTVYVEIKNKNIYKKLYYKIDTRKTKYFFKEVINNKTININLNVESEPIKDFIIIDTFNILKIIKININQYYNGFYYELNIYNNIIKLYFNKPINSYLLYKLNNYGIPINNKDKGTLYFRLIIDNNINQTIKQNIKNFDNIKPIQPTIVPFF